MKSIWALAFCMGLAAVVGLLWLPGNGVESVAPGVELRSYYFGLIKRGPAYTSKRSAEGLRVGLAHLKNIDDLIAADKMVLAGPFETPADEGEGALAGLFIYDVETEAEAIELAASDPAVVAGRLTIEILTWYGPKGITFPGQD